MELQVDSTRDWERGPVAVLVSGGLDSAILLADLSRTSPRVVPVYVRFGLVWEDAEHAGLQNFLQALSLSNVEPVKVFELSARQIYDRHWSTTGQEVPAADTPDEAVFLPGRNLLLLAQTTIWCSLQKIPTIAMAPLGSNPFPDSSDAFFDAFHAVIQNSVADRVTVVRPYGHLSKREVMLRGEGLPLEKTFSCIQPQGMLHCGRCNKCAERQNAFKDASMADTTQYASPISNEEPNVSCNA